MQNQNRVHPRMPAFTRVDWCVSGGATHVVSSLGNLSAGGAFVQTSVAAPVGSPVEMRLLTEVGAVPTRGAVAWADTTGMGIRFAK
jgi:hypothetical protein